MINPRMNSHGSRGARRAASRVLVGAAGAARAVLLTPRTEAGRFTLGATELWFHRDTEWIDAGIEREAEYNLGAFWAKYGFHRRLTVFAEFAVLNGDPHNAGVSYRYFNLGIGANVLFFEFEDFYAGALFGYFENFQHDNQPSACHSTTRHYAALLQIGRVVPFGVRHQLDAWWGPSYAHDEQVFDGGCSGSENKSLNDFGVAGGLDFLFWDHLELFGHVIFAGHFQPRLGIGYRF
jgi:hypothetical protein